MTANPLPLSARAAAYIRKHSLLSDRENVLVAVSGGPDSVALLDILANLKDSLNIERITVIHFNHRLRGDESDADRDSVRDLARSSGLDFRCGTANVGDFARKRKISIEMAARECRRAFFMNTAAELNAGKIALGHTADDQSEEVILRILRGTGPAGIQGMIPATAEGIIRPLLFATRDSIMDYLRARGLGFREDSTNLEPFCQRNFLRLKIFPLLREVFHPQIVETIARCADLAREEESWWESRVQSRWNDICLEHSEALTALDYEKLRQLHPAVLRRILRMAIVKVRDNLAGVGLVHIEPLVELVFSGKSGKSVWFPGRIEAVRYGERLLIRRMCIRASGQENPFIEISGPGDYRFGEFSFEISFSDGLSSCSTDSERESVRMDAEKLKWPLVLRSWKPGDRFHPLGMTGSKKLQDFFTDCRVPKEDRKKVPLLCDREKICWVAGMRIDDRVKVDRYTGTILVVKFRRCYSDGEPECEKNSAKLLR